MNTRRLIEVIVACAVFLILGYAFLAWSADHDKKVGEAADKYEACILKEYNLTPIKCRAEHAGEWCECK